MSRCPVFPSERCWGSSGSMGSGRIAAVRLSRPACTHCVTQTCPPTAIIREPRGRRDFMLLIPAGDDGDPDSTPKFDTLVAMSRKASLTRHPAVLSTWKADGDATVFSQQGDDWVLRDQTRRHASGRDPHRNSRLLTGTGCSQFVPSSPFFRPRGRAALKGNGVQTQGLGTTY